MYELQVEFCLEAKGREWIFRTCTLPENVTMPWTVEAVAQASAAGLNATFVNMSTACWAVDEHGIGNADYCDGCAGHPGVQGHRNMAKAAAPVMANIMGWELDPVYARKIGNH